MSPELWGTPWVGLSTLSLPVTPFPLGAVPCSSSLALFHQPAGKWGAVFLPAPCSPRVLWDSVPGCVVHRGSSQAGDVLGGPCLVALRTFVSSHIVPTISGCSQALFASYCNSGAGGGRVLLWAPSPPAGRTPVQTWYLSFPHGLWEQRKVSDAAHAVCSVLWHEERDLGLQDPRGSILVSEATESRQLLTAWPQALGTLMQ